MKAISKKYVRYNMEILSFSSFGYEGEIIKIEADLRRGLPVTDIVGLPGSAVREARERVRAAIRNSDLDFPNGRILINLSPADKKKEGSSFDLPIALGILTAKEKKENTKKESAKRAEEVPIMIMGELELSGKIRPVRGVLGAISTGSDLGIRYFIVPKENEAEATISKNASVFGASTLIEALEFFCQIEKISQEENSTKPKNPNACKTEESASGNESEISEQENESLEAKIKTKLVAKIIWSEEEDNGYNEYNNHNEYSISGFEDIRGQEKLLRALQVAAAGGHNLIAYGPPGCGKTLSLRRFNYLLPDMDHQTAYETTRIYSVAGLLPKNQEKNILLKRPPFRMPHQNASLEGIIGGAGKCMPGEVSLAHGGTLFLDEATQFKSSVLQTLRAPLETGCVTLSRAGRTSSFPANFQLLIAINPCPCGNFGAEGKICTCLPNEVENYWRKLTAPLLDRIDIRVPVFPPKAKALLETSLHSTEKMREKIKKAKIMQWERAVYFAKEKNKKMEQRDMTRQKPFKNSTKNANISPKDTPRICVMSDSAKALFEGLVEKKRLSGRGSHAILKIARTIADIESSEKLSTMHIEEAVALREWIKYLPDFCS